MARIDVKGPITDKTLNALNHNLIELYNMRNVLQTQINDLVLDAGKSDQEVAQARGGHKVLADRLNETEQKIEDKHIETMSQLEKTEQSLDDKKADKGALSQIAQSKRDKDVEIEMKDLSQGVKEAMTGDSVAVVGEDAVGNVNLKENAVTRDKMDKNYAVNYPYLSDDSFDLDYVWDEGNYIVSGPVLNNPFGTGCALNVKRHKTRGTNKNVWIVQSVTVYGSGSDVGDTKKRLLRIDEDTLSIDILGEWKNVTGIDFSDDMLSDDYAYKDYLGGDEYNLNDIKGEGNYIVNANVINNPFKEGVSMSVTRHKLNKDDDVLWIVQDCVVYGSVSKRGDRAWRIIRYKSNGDFDWASDWQGDVGNKTINVLWISNSFGLNTTEYIHQIANSADVNIVTGNLYISGGLLSDHYDNLVNDSKVYRFDTKGNEMGNIINESVNDVSIDEAINMRDWDYVVLNQASAQSGVYDTFQPYLNDIISHVKSKLPDVKIALMPTWAYSNNFDDNRFDKYDNDQLTMHEDIMKAYKDAMEDVGFDLIIPTGTAIQNARTDEYMLSVDDELTRDGYHLDETGMYIAGLTFYKTFFKNERVEWKPSSISSKSAYIAHVTADNAVLNPFKVTEV